ncbi:MAG: acetate--CoA ligase family protein, partial [Dehalococcoidia bacterium]|nr:acetate--CoA ligase family protein [Dehalococcoidia bacterium]
MKLHEYQARDLLAANGVAVTSGRVARTAAEAGKVAGELGGKVVVKAQIHAGGRGKGRLVEASETAAMYEKLTSDPANNAGQVKGDRVGGVRLADTVAEAEAAAGAILGKHLVSIQTGPEGKLVKTVLVAEQTDIVKEYYLSVLVDGSVNGHLFIASAEGGQEIEHVAATNPDAIARVAVNSASGWEGYVGRTLAQRLGFTGDQAAQFATLAEALYKTACATDASLVEINPLALTADGRVVAVDAKLTIDDNALYRHKDLADLRDKDEEDPLEVMAQEMGVSNFIKLDGNIGCIVNGAGL